MSILDPEGAERHMRDAEFTRMRQAQVEREPARVRVYDERKLVDDALRAVEVHRPQKRRRLARRKR
jgi:hypothetical protein